MGTVIRANSLIILPAGARFMLAGTAPDPPPRMATNTLARVTITQGVVQVETGSTLVRSPAGIYAELVDKAIDEQGGEYAAGQTVFIPPDSAVSVAAKVGGGTKAGDPIQVVQAQPYPTSAKAMASGIAMTATAFVLVWVGVG